MGQSGQLVEKDRKKRPVTAAPWDRFLPQAPGASARRDCVLRVFPSHRTVDFHRAQADPEVVGDALVGKAGAQYEQRVLTAASCPRMRSLAMSRKLAMISRPTPRPGENREPPLRKDGE